MEPKQPCVTVVVCLVDISGGPVILVVLSLKLFIFSSFRLIRKSIFHVSGFKALRLSSVFVSCIKSGLNFSKGLVSPPVFLILLFVVRTSNVELGCG